MLYDGIFYDQPLHHCERLNVCTCRNGRVYNTFVYLIIRMKIYISDNITKERYQLRIRCVQIISSLLPQAVTVLCNSLRYFSCLATSAGVLCPSLFSPTSGSQWSWDLMTSQASLWTRTPYPASGTMANGYLSYLSGNMHDTFCGCRIYKYWVGVVCAKVIKILSRSGVCQGDKNI